MDHSPGVYFEDSLVNMNEAKALTNINQPEKYKKKYVPVRLHQELTDCLQGFTYAACYAEGQNISLEDGTISI